MKKTIYRSILSVLFASILWSGATAAEKLTIAVHDYPPYYDKQGQGVLSDMYQAACDAAGLDLTIIVLPIKRGIEGLFSNKVDAFSPGHIFLSAEQNKKVSIIKTFVVLVVYTYYNPNKDKNYIFKDFTSLRGKKLGVITNTAFGAYYKQAGVSYSEKQTPQILLKMLRAKRFELVENTLLSAMTILQNMFPSEMTDFAMMDSIAIEGSLAFNNGNPRSKSLLKKFSKGFETIKRNGEYVRIFESYWGKNNIQKNVLPKDLVEFGVEKSSLAKFAKYKRNAWGKIIQ